MNSVFKHREDKSDETLSRLTDGWNGKKSRSVFQRKQKNTKKGNNDFHTSIVQTKGGFSTGPVEALEEQFNEISKEFETKALPDEPNIHLSQNCDAVANKTLTRLSQEWFGKTRSNLPIINEAQEEIALEKLNLAQTLSSTDKVTLHHIDEEMAPSLLVDWKIWGIKITVLILIPIFLVLGGGIKHISNISPELAKYCHSQALVMQEAFEGKSSTNAAENHFALSEIYIKQRESRLAIDHAHKAAKIYAYDCLKKINKTLGDWQTPFLHSADLEPSLSKLRNSLTLAANAAEQRKYVSLSNTYWKLAVSLDPEVVPDIETSNMLVANRIKAAKSFAFQRKSKETIKVLNDAFKVLLFEDVRTIYYCYDFEKTEVSDDNVKAFEKAIYLHQILADYYKEFGDDKTSCKQREIAKKLYKHLASFIAIRQLNKNWFFDSKRYKGEELRASFFINNNKISSINVGPYSKSNKDVRQLIRRDIDNKLNGRTSSNNFSFEKFLQRKHPNPRIELVVNKTGFQMNDIQRNEVSQSPYMELNQRNRNGTKDFRKAIVNVSKSL